jgi:preprotein translocase subunit SecG
VTLFLWIVIIFVLVVCLAVLVSPPSPDAPRGLPQNKGRYYKDE